MMHWFQTVLAAHLEITFFVVLGIGYVLGKIALGSFRLGAVMGTLIAGVLVGQLGLVLPREVKECFFLLFLFAIGFRTGPQFFLSLRKDGLQHAALAAIVATSGLIAAYVLAWAFGYDPGTGGGLVAGAMTESAAIGTAMDAIGRLPAPEAARLAMANNIPVAFAVTYMIGMTGAIWFLSHLAPRIMRVDLAEECRRLEDQQQVERSVQASARRDFELRAFAIEVRWRVRRAAAQGRGAPRQHGP
jgi:putative transport protein